MKIIPFWLSITILLLGSSSLKAQDYYKNERKHWLDVAQKTTPKLVETIKRPISVIKVEKDAASFQGWKIVKIGTTDSSFNKSFKKQTGIILDFGEHLTGFVTFKIEDFGRAADAPIRLKFTFGEVPAEVAEPFDPYKGGLSRAWLQDEIITISEVPKVITIPRRLAFRYAKIELLGSSVYSDFKISDIFVKATTSVTHKAAALASSTPAIIKQIDQIGLNIERMYANSI